MYQRSFKAHRGRSQRGSSLERETGGREPTLMPSRKVKAPVRTASTSATLAQNAAREGFGRLQSQLHDLQFVEGEEVRTAILARKSEKEGGRCCELVQVSFVSKDAFPLQASARLRALVRREKKKAVVRCFWALGAGRASGVRPRQHAGHRGKGERAEDEKMEGRAWVLGGWEVGSGEADDREGRDGRLSRCCPRRRQRCPRPGPQRRRRSVRRPS